MSSITDKPIGKKNEDLLSVEKYSLALSNFIMRSDTPITIGLQGEWGTGKTSLMSLLLEDFSEKNIACSWVNTWEFAMFKGAHETTPNVLRGMLEKLKTEAERRGVWTIRNESNEKFRKAAKFIGNLANQVISKQTGVDLQSAAEGAAGQREEAAAEIAQIKELIASVINDLIEDTSNPIEKVVFFVDDLDRIPPGDAVEVLEALKNIFDIPNCVFVLAIDYDVVVKGLESKFGPKSDENEREFRSFFDKIIQVPFSMPVGTYDIENFLVKKLEELKVPISEENKEFYTKTVRYTIGHNPRSLKRYLNSFSLINHLKELDEESDSEDEVYMLFSILGIQISYPRIFRMLAQQPDFTSWNKGFASKAGIEWNTVVERLEKYGENELVDEEWEQVCWAFCQTDAYLKSRSFSLLELLNVLREKYKEELVGQISNAMTFAAITSVDDDISTKQEVQKIGNKTIYGGLDTKLTQLTEEGFDNVSIELFSAFWSVLDQKASSDSKYRISYAKTGCGFYNEALGGRGKTQLIYCKNPSRAAKGYKLWVKSNNKNVSALYDELKATYALDNQETFYRSKNGDLMIEANLYGQLGREQYLSLLQHLASKIN
jgi:hypothetical protein